MNPGILAIALTFAVPLAFIIGIVVICVVAILRGSNKSNKKMSAEEARLMQEIHRGMQKMEQRIETLETILLEPASKEKSHD